MSSVQIVINVSGGLVQGVYCSTPDAEVTLVDFDVDGVGVDEPRIVRIIANGLAEYVFVDQFQPHDLESLAGTAVERAIQAAGVLV